MTASARAARAPDWTHETGADLPERLDAWTLWLRLNEAAPGWMAPAMRIRDAISARFGVRRIADDQPGPEPDRPRPAPGERVGFFTVHDISDERLTLLVEDGHLDVLTHIRALPAPSGTRAEIGSEVWTWNLVGRLYMIPTGPGHRLLVGAMLRRLARS